MLKIQQIRKERGIPQHRLGVILDLPQSAVSDFERGKRRIHLDQAVKIAQFLEVKLDDLVEQS